MFQGDAWHNRRVVWKLLSSLLDILSRIPRDSAVQLLSLGEFKLGRKWDSRVSRKRISRVGWCIATGGKRQKLTMPAFTGDLEPGGCRFVGVRAFVLTRVHVSSELAQSSRAGCGWGTRPLQIFLYPSFFPNNSPLRNAWNDNARASLRFESSRVEESCTRELKKRLGG